MYAYVCLKLNHLSGKQYGSCGGGGRGWEVGIARGEMYNKYKT